MLFRTRNTKFKVNVSNHGLKPCPAEVQDDYMTIFHINHNSIECTVRDKYFSRLKILESSESLVSSQSAVLKDTMVTENAS